MQKILNIKISQRFPTAVTLADSVFYVMVIVFFQLAVISSVEARNSPWYIEDVDGVMMPNGDNFDKKKHMHMPFLVPLYVAVVYFSAREITQAMSLGSLGLFHTWLWDFENWLDVIYISLILFWSIVMTVEGLNDRVFQNGAAISMAVFWIMVLSFLQSIEVGFAVFVGGVIYVVKRLVAFLVALVIILIGFAQIFYTLFRLEYCLYSISFTDLLFFFLPFLHLIFFTFSMIPE